jgi:hypothetical protein
MHCHALLSESKNGYLTRSGSISAGQMAVTSMIMMPGLAQNEKREQFGVERLFMIKND